MVPRNELEAVPKRARSRLTLAVGAAAAVVVVVAVLLPGDRPEVGARAPQFSLPRLDGRGRVSSDALEGSPVVVNFWASWCTPCREEAPLLERAWRAHRDEGVQFLGINVADQQPDARAFVEDFDLTYPVVVDAEGDVFADMASVEGLPQTLFVDHRWRYLGGAVGAPVGEQEGSTTLGAIDAADLERRIEALVDAAREARADASAGAQGPAPVPGGP